MLVDDNADFLRMLSTALPMITDAEIECFNSSTEALAAFALAPERYALVMTDLEMPDVNGVELCGRLRLIAPAQKIFLMTGSGLFTAATARQAGFDALLNKPFSTAMLRTFLAASEVESDTICAA